MPTISLEEAQAKLAEIIARLGPGEELVILRDEQPVAKIVGESAPVRQPRRPGLGKGSILYIADDFDAPLDDMKEHMG